MKKIIKVFIILVQILFLLLLGNFNEFNEIFTYCEPAEISDKNYKLFLIALFLVSLTLLSKNNVTISEITKEDVEAINAQMAQILEILDNIKE